MPRQPKKSTASTCGAPSPKPLSCGWTRISFSRTNIQPTAADIVQRFGINSPTFQLVRQAFSRLLRAIEHDSELEVWRGQWKALLSKVYGSDIADDELFVRHSYLSQFAKLLAFAALEGRPDVELIPSIVDGKAFHKHGVGNIGENDFFSWLMMPAIRPDAIKALHALSVELQVYDLSAVRQDLLKQLYQNLVDPETRHDLGEYYTPDWLAQLTLKELDYGAPQSLLDPACGSGTFLFNAMRRLADQGLTGYDLVDFALNNIVGMDVHPLAVTIARVNYLLALSEHLLHETDFSGLLSLPVYMADALIEPAEDVTLNAITIPVNPSANEVFRIPTHSASDANKLNLAIQQMDEFANAIAARDLQGDQMVTAFKRVISNLYEEVDDPVFLNHWASNLRLLYKLIREKRDRIWSYILANMSRPLILAEKQFDIVVGNPPWLAYRYIRGGGGQAEIKRLVIHYKLVASRDVTLFTQMDLSTLFFAHAREKYLKADGTLAFVMPRSVITGAKQHRLFQRQGISRILDFLDVSPLFNVPAVVLILERGRGKRQDIPTKTYRASLSKHEMPLVEAAPELNIGETKTRFVDSEVRSPYFGRFVVGASLFPRNLCFVRPSGIPSSPAVESDSELDRDAKPPWKGLRVQGTVHDDYLFATLQSKNLLPFGYQRLKMVALPIRVLTNRRLEVMHGLDAFAEKGHISSYSSWFKKTQDLWEKLKKSKMSLIERYDYHKLLSKQNPAEKFLVLYNASGTNLASCVLCLEHIDLSVFKRKTQAFIADYKTYYAALQSSAEAHYLCGILNSSYVNASIKNYQSQGLYGHRDISRTPFEACAIPIFDANDSHHQALARLSLAAHAKIDELKGMDENQLLNGRPGQARSRAREFLADELAAIDEITRLLLDS